MCNKAYLLLFPGDLPLILWEQVSFCINIWKRKLYCTNEPEVFCIKVENDLNIPCILDISLLILNIIIACLLTWYFVVFFPYTETKQANPEECCNEQEETSRIGKCLPWPILESNLSDLSVSSQKVTKWKLKKSSNFKQNHLYSNWFWRESAFVVQHPKPPGVEFRRELRESIWILLSGVCESLRTFLHSVCVKLLTVY